MQIEETSLFYSEGRSDKVYHIQLAQDGEGYVVNYQYGRRGTALTCGSKTKEPVPFEKAKSVYEKTVSEKVGKGYTPDASGTAYQNTPKGDLFTGILPQLLNPVDESELEFLFKDSRWCLQEKHDGERRMASNVGGEWFGINRKGMRVALPLPLVDALVDLPNGTILDGEIIGDVFYPFDLLQVGGDDLRPASYEDRLNTLVEILSAVDSPCVVPVVSLVSEGDKRHTFSLIRSRNGEGVVFKLLHASHTVGRPNSGGDHLKFKFVESGTFFVSAQNDTKRSVQVAAFNENGNRVELGNVTIPPNYAVPDVGAIVEVEYLYAFQNPGSLFQPVYRGLRTDMEPEDCKTSQLKYKPEVSKAA